MTPRDYSLDAARGILIMLGIVLHAANIYTIDGEWLIADVDRGQLFDLVSSAISVFRMPVFFWISGYFVAATFGRAGSAGLLRHRLVRIVVPLAATWVTFNVIQEATLAIHQHRDPWNAVSHGVPIGHLWFLVDLAVYIVLAAAILPLVATRSAPAPGLLRSNAVVQIAILALASYTTVLIVRATGVSYESVFFGSVNLHDLANFAPFFACGALMQDRPEIRERFLRVPGWAFFLALPMALTAHWYEHDFPRAVREFALLVDFAAVWVCIAALLGLFRSVFTNESPATRFFSETSYSVYLFHHCLVVWLGILLLGVGIPPLAKFAIICVTVGVTASLAHYLIVRRVPIVRFLYNGK